MGMKTAVTTTSIAAFHAHTGRDTQRQLAALGKNGGSQSMKDLKADFDAKAEKEAAQPKFSALL